MTFNKRRCSIYKKRGYRNNKSPYRNFHPSKGAHHTCFSNSPFSRAIQYESGGQLKPKSNRIFEERRKAFARSNFQQRKKERKRLSRADPLSNPLERNAHIVPLTRILFPSLCYLWGCRSIRNRKGSWRDWSRPAAKVWPWRSCSTWARTPSARRNYACAAGRSASRGRCRRIEASRESSRRRPTITLDPRDGCSSMFRTASRERSSSSRCTGALHRSHTRFDKILTRLIGKHRSVSFDRAHVTIPFHVSNRQEGGFTVTHRGEDELILQ